MNKKSLLLLILSIFVLTCVSCNSSNKVTVFEKGETDYTIVTEKNASEEALDFAKGLAALSGAVPELRTDESPESALEILVGDTNRAATLSYVEGLKELSTASAFHYIVAENDGKIVILSDSDIGYLYALEFIKNNYIDDGVLSIPRGTYNLERVIWDDYYSSDLYFERLTAEADKNRFEEEDKQFDNEMNRYEDNKGNNILTVTEAIEQYRKLAANFNTADFGEYTSNTFIDANTYGKPTVYPGEAHPRVMFTSNTVDELREKIKAPESAAAYKRYIALSNAPCDGKFETVMGNMTQNFESEMVARIEAKAFRYAMTGEKIYGYEAIYAAKNAMLTIDVPHTVGDWCRTYGYLMYGVACVYDWCYDLMTEADKTQMINGAVNLLGKHFEIVCYSGPGGDKVPTKQGTMYGHGAEDQLLVDYLSFAIACYNEAPEIYELVAGRILNDYTEAQNFLFQSGSHWEGTMYGSVRTASTVVSNVLFNKMTDGKVTPFKNVDQAIITSTYYIRPDGHVFRIGDTNENNTAYQFVWFANCCFYAGNLYENDYLKSMSYKYLKNFTSFTTMVAGLSPVQFLVVNNPEVSHSYNEEAPLTRTTSFPNTNIFAKSANNDENAYSIYMTMPENYVSSHAHAECGSFQIFYKAPLVSDSGAYTRWGGPHHMGYNMQTISSNSLLIYNPNLEGTFNSTYTNMVYTGGQSVKNCAPLPDTLSELMAHPAFGQCTSLGVANVEENRQYLYSYMGGDMTKAYDDVTVDEVTRYMFSIATGNEACPFVFLTFDRVTSDDASYKKTALIHVQKEPTLTSDGFAVITNGEGRAVVQSVNFDTSYTVIGGEGKEFWVNGKNVPTETTLVEGSLAEYGWGRIEISPTVAEKTNHMLTVLYVTDSDNNSAPVKAEDISSEGLAGAMIFGKAVLFPKNEKLLTTESSFTLSGAGECFVGGVKEGKWSIMNGSEVVDTVTVSAGTNLIRFNAKTAGTYILTPAK